MKTCGGRDLHPPPRCRSRARALPPRLTGGRAGLSLPRSPAQRGPLQAGVMSGGEQSRSRAVSAWHGLHGAPRRMPRATWPGSVSLDTRHPARFRGTQTPGLLLTSGKKEARAPDPDVRRSASGRAMMLAAAHTPKLSGEETGGRAGAQGAGGRRRARSRSRLPVHRSRARRARRMG